MIPRPKREFGIVVLLPFFAGVLGVFFVFLGFTDKNNFYFWVISGVLIVVVALMYSSVNEKNFEEKMRIFEEQQVEKRRMEEEASKRKQRDIEEYEKSQKAKGLIKITRYGKEHWVTQEQEREWKFIDIDLENNFQKLTPRQFEKAIEDLFKKMNYNVTLTQYTGDYGADLIIKKDSETLVVQCKKYMEQNKVGAVEVQKTLGSMYKYNANKAILITTSDFTNQARIQAREAPIELWNKRVLREHFMKVYLTNS